MAKIIQRPEDCFEEITADYREIFGCDLLSVTLYGSGAGSDYQPGKSDLNFLIVLTDAGIKRFGSAMDTVIKWRKRMVAIPLFMTKADILSSLDSYPIEFINMKISHRHVYGENTLDDLCFLPTHLRMQLERELKSKQLHLRSGFLASEGKAGKVKDLIGVSLNAFIALFIALLHLNNVPVPKGKRRIIEETSKVVAFDAAVFLKCADIREGARRFSDNEIGEVFAAYLEEIGRLCDTVDKHEV